MYRRDSGHLAMNGGGGQQQQQQQQQQHITSLQHATASLWDDNVSSLCILSVLTLHER